MPLAPLELWGGVECTCNRVGERFFDQLELSGHARRLDDLDLFAALGFRTLRYPVLWERTAPDGLERARWDWPDERLARLRALGIRPIAGLVHHGSGPRHTSLTDPAFAEGLAAFAGAVARRYPWLEAYTPVNEPLTTARFSGLYGHWYPHGHDSATMVRALLVQCRATVLAMRAVRAISPDALLVQTEDLGKVFSTPALAYQADFENERRWLSLDLLCGTVDRKHPMWGYLRDSGAAAEEIEWFAANPCPPDIIGFNYYLTGERFLDERVEHYPHEPRGGNGRHTYVDVAAVHVCAGGLAGHAALLAEAWARYRRPLAITEVHCGGAREDQLRWLAQAWRDALRLRGEGVDVRAVTAWAILGSHGWNTLVTRESGHYEPGLFDLRGAGPRPTALARLARQLNTGETPAHPVLGEPGWWGRPERLCFGCTDQTPAPDQRAPAVRSAPARRPILLTGAGGTLGRAFARICAERGLHTATLTRRELDIADPAAVAARCEELRPWAVVNASGFVRVDEAERAAAQCFRANSDGAAVLAAACARYGAQLLTFSTDLVFDGQRRRPYLEHDSVGPLNVYGQSKAAAELQVCQLCPSALIIRTSAFFGPWDDHNFLTVTLRALARGEQVCAAEDLVISPTYVPDLVHSCLDLLIDGERGCWHLAQSCALSWADFARWAAELAGYTPDRVIGAPHESLGWAARRPAYSALGSARGALLPPFEDALARYVSLHRAARPST
jgi:dTDP-4-dehydrorhamnose reductase